MIEVMEHYGLGREVFDYPMWMIQGMKMKQELEEVKEKKRDKMLEAIYRMLVGGR